MTTYKEAGVNIEAGEETVRRITPLVRETFTPGVLTDIGAFGGFYELATDRYEQPVLVSSVDGVGTKLKVAFRTGRHGTVGQDLVNHCVNDIAVCGARPLFFLDYLSTGSLAPNVAEEIIGGFAVACKQNGCALIGGETAEMPDIYAKGEYDLAGSIVGIVEKDQILDGSRVEGGDVLVGLASSGLHTNGYSLARKVLFSAFDVDDAPPELSGETIGDALLHVHRSYLDVIQALIEEDLAQALAHITGGGLPGNVRRVVPNGLEARIEYEAWTRPPIFSLIQEKGQVPEEDMRKTFNLGIGLVAIVRERDLERTQQIVGAQNVETSVVGRIASET